MKQKYILHDNINNTVEERVIEVPNKMHFDAQRTFRASVQRPLKGKGSYTRKQKYKETF